MFTWLYQSIIVHVWYQIRVPVENIICTATPKNVNQIEVLKTEILWKILHTIEHFIKLVLGEKHFELECLLSRYF